METQRNRRLRIILIGIFGIIFCIYLKFRHYPETSDFEIFVKPREVIVKSPFVKNVLIWTSPTTEPLNHLGHRNETFYKRNCTYKNCYITSERRILKTTEFDAVVFHGPEMIQSLPHYLPKERSNQSYIFSCMESSQNYQVPDKRYNGIFNFTWTYKLNSDIRFAYIAIRDDTGKVIGPNKGMDWKSIYDMSPIGDAIKAKLAHKKIAAAWFVSNCETLSKREVVANKVIAELKKYNMRVDVYGTCGDLECPRTKKMECFQKLQRDYYFYFAFENALCDDYVTDKLLHALQNYAVPIVYGGADYKRFMPDGIYLSVENNKGSVDDLVIKMVESISDKHKYYNFFKWHNHYSYHHPEEAADTDPYCLFCSFLNNIDPKKVYIKDKFYKWWNLATYGYRKHMLV